MGRRAVSEKDYVDSLEYFLASSGEDTVDFDGILEQLPIYAESTLEFLKAKRFGRVLDIDSGNGAKAIYLAHRLQELDISVVIDSMEPKAEQRALLAKNYQGKNQQFLGTVFGKTFQEIKAGSKYDLTIAIHSLYEFPRNEEGELLSLDLLDYIITERGAGVIIIEHPHGDFQKIKRELYPVFGKRPPISQDIVVRSLERVRIPYNIGDTIECRFSIERIMNDGEAKIGKMMSFLFSESLDDEPLTDHEYRTIGRWVKTNARQDKENRSYLWTPNSSVWTYSRRTTEAVRPADSPDTKRRRARRESALELQQ